MWCLIYFIMELFNMHTSHGSNFHFLQTFPYPPSRFRLTCAYLSCKVDEFNVSSTQFVGNLLQETPAGQERVLEQILEYELLLIQQLNFHLVVHNPYRPMEGLLIDLKVPRSFNSTLYTAKQPSVSHRHNTLSYISSLRRDTLYWRTQRH